VIPVTGIDAISKRILENYDYNECITFGILIADYQQSEAKQYIINYLDMFDEKSGKYIDFFVPGYYVKSKDIIIDYEKRYHPNMEIRWDMESETPAFVKNNIRYYFSESIFKDFLFDLEHRMGIKYTYNPMLILVEVKKGYCRGQIEFQDRMIIELDDTTSGGVKRSGELFNAIFEFAKREVGLDKYGKLLRMYYIKGNVVNRIASALSGNWVESVTSTVEDTVRYRISRKR